MLVHQVFERVNELTKRYGNLTLDEIKELRLLSSRLQKECADAIYDMEREKEIEREQEEVEQE